MKINKNLINKKEWFDLDEDKNISFKIRPFPASHNVLRLINNIDEIEITWKQFNYSLVDWKGITDENDKPLECNDINKKMLFDYSQDVVLFVFNKSSEKASKVLEKKT